MGKFWRENWQGVFFGAVGLVFLGFSFCRLWQEDVAGGSATFGMAFLCFIYANLSRFKRFKGLGFEAELWEDKQKEAAALIDRLKAKDAIYTEQIVRQNIMGGRLGSASSWEDNWRLFDRLVAEHEDLGQDIDFSDLKADIDAVFLFDLTSYPYDPLHRQIAQGVQEASDLIQKEFGSAVEDVEGHRKRTEQVNAIKRSFVDRYERSLKGNVAQEILDWARDAQAALRRDFGVEVSFPEEDIQELEMLADLRRKGPIKVTPKLLEMSERKSHERRKTGAR